MQEMKLLAGAGAFGDGSHESTRGVLEMLARLDPAAFAPRSACDVGAGSGIISLAITQKFACPVMATDIAKSAVDMIRANALANNTRCHPHPPTGVGPSLSLTEGEGTSEARGEGEITPLQADGFAHPKVAERAPFDLIVMNILPEPLVKLARDAEANLAAGGALILAGILIANESIIIQAYQMLDLELTARIVIGDWVTLLWQKA